MYHYKSTNYLLKISYSRAVIRSECISDTHQWPIVYTHCMKCWNQHKVLTVNIYSAHAQRLLHNTKKYVQQQPIKHPSKLIWITHKPGRHNEGVSQDTLLSEKFLWSRDLKSFLQWMKSSWLYYFLTTTAWIRG